MWQAHVGEQEAVLSNHGLSPRPHKLDPQAAARRTIGKG